METRNSLTNFLGETTYSAIPVPRHEKVQLILKFIQYMNGTALNTIFNVGFGEIERRIINSSRALSCIADMQYNIHTYTCILNNNRYALKNLLEKEKSKCADPQYRLYILFIYIYFVSLSADRYMSINITVSRQQVLDMMFAYATTNKDIHMLEFIFCAIVSERQLTDGITNLKCSQYDDIDNIIKSFKHGKDQVLSAYQNGSIDKPYIDSYTDAYSEALEFETELEKEYKYSILEIKD
jgi:hypothetical protein